MMKLFVVGAGAWGTALGVLLAGQGHQVSLWTRRADHAAMMREERRNEARLPGIVLPAQITPTAHFDDLASHDGVLFVVPAQVSRQHFEEAREASARAAMPVALCSKGLERATMSPMHLVLQDAWPEARGAVLSGPSFAADVARGLPTAVTLAAEQDTDQQFWLAALATPTFRPYASDDPLGAEIGGAVKNVLAVACGVAVGKGLGDSARAALIARGFAEMQRLGAAMGARPETLAGLSGLGDLVLTCGSTQSRNFSLGVALGQGADPRTYLNEQPSIAEGAATAHPLTQKARALRVEMPICDSVAALLAGETDVDALIHGLMNRPIGSEA